jgi:hypothetical protein
MTTISGPNVPRGNLQLHIDASNIRSMRGRRSLINWDTWFVGNGSVTGYTMNGTTDENSREVSTDPWGKSNIVWTAYPAGNNAGNGGWNGSQVPIDNSKLYRFSVWHRRTSSVSNGNFYLGLTSGAGYVIHLSDGVNQPNAYWDYGNISLQTQNQWYLTVGHVFPWNHTGNTVHPESGRYTITSGKVSSNAGNIPNDCKWTANATSVAHRSYLFYNTDVTARLQFYQPRIDLVDGTEPSINDLLNDAGSRIYNLISPSNVGNLVNNPTYSNGTLSFNGVNSHIIFGDTIDSYLFPGQNLTFTALVNITAYDASAGSSIIDKFSSKGIRFYVGTTGYLVCQTRDDSSNLAAANSASLSGGVPLSLGQWYFVCMTHNFTTNEVVMYVNMAATVPTNLAFGRASTSSVQTYIGYMPNNLRYANMKIATASIYDRILSEEELRMNFEAVRGRFNI